MEKGFNIKKKVTFSDAMKVYRKVIEIGILNLNNYSFHIYDGQFKLTYDSENMDEPSAFRHFGSDNKSLKPIPYQSALEKIAKREITHMSANKSPKQISVKGHSFKIPLVANKNIQIERNNDIYIVNITADSAYDAAGIERKLRDII